MNPHERAMRDQISRTKYNLRQRGVPTSLEEEVDGIIALWKDESGLQGRAAACLEELLEKMDNLREEFDDEYYHEDQVSEIRFEYETQLDDARYEYSDLEDENSRLDAKVDELERHTAELESMIPHTCEYCAMQGCSVECQMYDWEEID